MGQSQPFDTHKNVTPDIYEALDNYLENYAKGGHPVSVKNAIGTIRNSVTDCELPDDLLSNIVAEYAISRGFNLYFDQQKGAEICTWPF